MNSLTSRAKMVRLGWRYACLAKKYLHPSLFVKEIPPAAPPGHELFGGKRPRLGVRITPCGNKSVYCVELYSVYYCDIELIVNCYLRIVCIRST